MLLDRDGVLNRAFEHGDTTRPPRELRELEILPGVREALARLRAAGFALVGVSNQPDVRRGSVAREVVEALNARLVAELGLLDIVTCFHDDSDACACRKPRPGLLHEAARRFELDLPRSVMVGDRWSDVAAGRAAGCRAVLLETPYSRVERCAPDAVVSDLGAAASVILSWASSAADGVLPSVAVTAAHAAERDLSPILSKLRCRTCRVAVAAGAGGWRCAGGHPFSAGGIEGAGCAPRRPLGERVFNHARVYRAKMALLGLLNPLPKDALDPWTAGREVLDLGCGPFQYLYDPEAPALRVGVDRSAEAMRIADGLYPRSLHLVASVDEPLPFADGSFDVALLLFVLHHLPPAVVPGLLAEAARVARGQILVFDHVRSDVPWQRALQQTYWDTFDGGDLYRSQGEWDELWRGWRVVEQRRLGRMFRNVCFYRIAL